MMTILYLIKAILLGFILTTPFLIRYYLFRKLKAGYYLKLFDKCMLAYGMLVFVIISFVISAVLKSSNIYLAACVFALPIIIGIFIGAVLAVYLVKGINKNERKYLDSR